MVEICIDILYGQKVLVCNSDKNRVKSLLEKLAVKWDEYTEETSKDQLGKDIPVSSKESTSASVSSEQTELSCIQTDNLERESVSGQKNRDFLDSESFSCRQNSESPVLKTGVSLENNYEQPSINKGNDKRGRGGMVSTCSIPW